MKNKPLMRKDPVPNTDVLDIDREPSDDEMESLMQDMVNTVNTKQRKTWGDYMRNLYADMNKAAEFGAE